ncbi:hypothetical protein BOTBODRAFT_254274 [Botryobasidium botryosum FD-172 SS1]|uniref:Uncharacterized protein n=1 Tax=Botryobasidium botryosum (strain FD-172 SS1) TaxID=930990 RepID=A0A067LVV2_BOTB1|nr:hypothetical protein BOTBODRAFT_254274 [Botryobasidium botryosum FD-172 SS1]
MEAVGFEEASQLIQAFVDRIRLTHGHAYAQGHSERAWAALETEAKLVRIAVDIVNRCAAQVVTSINRRRNELTPVYRLPDEVLSLVFEHVDVSTEWQNPTEAAPLALLRVTSAWRQVALSTPKLWTYIDARRMPVPAIHTWIERSKRAPLDIVYNNLTGRMAEGLPALDGLKLVSTHVGRCCSLDLRNAAGINLILASPAHLLEKLSLAYSEEYGTHLDDPFSGVAPHLHELVLKGVFVPLDHSIYSGLSRLHLNYTPEILQTDELLRAVEASPQLETLIFENVQFSHPPQAHHSIIELLHLSTLRFHEVASWGIQSILTHIRTPPSSYLEVYPTMLTHPPFNTLGSIFPRSTGVEYDIQNLVLTQSLRVYSHSLGRYCWIDGSVGFTRLFSLEANTDERGGLVATLLPGLGAAFPLPFLRILFVASLGAEDATPFSAALDNLPTVEELTLEECHETIVAVLSSPQRIPRLRELSIVNSTLNESILLRLVQSRTGRDGRRNDTGPHSPGDETSLQCLRLSECPSITQFLVSTLRKHLREVCLDGGYGEEDAWSSSSTS